MVCDGDAWLRFGTLCYDMTLLASPNGSIGCIRFAWRVLCTHTPDYAAAIVQEIDTSPKKRLEYLHLDFTTSPATHLCMRDAKRSLPNCLPSLSVYPLLTGLTCVICLTGRASMYPR